MPTITGWLFDVYPSDSGMTVWIIAQDGSVHRCHADFIPSFFLHLNDSERRRAEFICEKSPVKLSATVVQRRELFSDSTWDMLEIKVYNPLKIKEVIWFFERYFPHYSFFNSDIPPAQLFLYDTDLFILGFGDYEIDEAGILCGWTLRDSRGKNDYTLPPFSIMKLENANRFIPPKYQRSLQLEIAYDGKSYAIEHENPREALESLNWHLYRCDPDIILTDSGDGVLMPKLTHYAEQFNIPLLFNRDNAAGYFTSRESSFFQYGKIIHKDGAFELAGRWHVDVGNSFTVSESSLDGLFELVRITQMAPQKQARASIGTGLSSLQLSWAYRNGIVIPAKKREPEDFKSAATLLLADRGGLIFQPPIGFHEDVAELDFVSMYPSIMVNNNVSPETVNCRCCNNAAVPELHYTICEKREGIVPATLRMVVDKRAHYKKMKKKYKGINDDLFRSYDRRQNALKWMLVSCFGYLGYKNARFGKIEAHESVNAFSRDAILTAKEVAEEQGFELLHAIIDCVWVKKEGATDADYANLSSAISARVGIDISLEGVYRWILFPASKQDHLLPTANRYVGWYRHNEIKIRGIETRRRDTPRFIKTMQEAMLMQMGNARTIEEIRTMLPEILDIARGYIATLRSGKANPMDLVLRRQLSKEAGEYTNNSISAVVSKMVENMGIHLSAGEAVDFIILDQSGKRKPEKAKPVALYAFEDGYDIETYTKFALKAVETLLLPFGYTVELLEELFCIRQKKPVKKKAENYTLELQFL